MRQEDVPHPFLHISDHLDMLGVKLTATYQGTRKINGDTLVEIVKKKTDDWKTGRFMPLTSRPWSVNSMIFSKIWFRMAVIDMRSGDIKKITSAVKSWIYQPQLVKPQEVLL